MWKRGCLWLGGMTLLALSVLIVINIPYQNFGENRLQISPSTTSLTGPLRADGSLDYIAAINQRHMDGIKPEENAVAVIFHLTPEGSFPESSEISCKMMRDQFARALGFSTTPPVLKLEDPETSIQNQLPQLAEDPKAYEEAEQHLEEFRSARKKPWKSSRFPEFAQVLKEQQEALNLIAKAAACPRYYHPLIVPASQFGNINLLDASLPMGQRFRQCVRVLLMRAMNSLGDGQPGNVASAIQDIQSARRLGWLQCQSISLTEKLIVAAIYRMVNEAEINLIASGQLTTQQLQDHQTYISKHKYQMDMADRIDFGERIIVLDQMQSLMTNPKQLGQHQNHSSPAAFQKNLMRGLVRSSDINTTLRVINQWFDRSASAANQPTIKQSLAAFEVIEDELSKFQPFDNWRSTVFSFVSGPKSRGQYIGNLLAAMLMPAGASLVRADFDVSTQDQLSEIAFAVSGYRSKYHKLPASLTMLVPEFLEQVELDQFDVGDIQYRFNETGFMVYSFGADGSDNGGRDASEVENRREYDIRISVGLQPAMENGSRKERQIKAAKDERTYREKLKKRPAKSRQDNLDANVPLSKATG
ncbi:MAG: hypothetical protein P8J33_02010 [Pirellulaceae bacterium]|nr:hypothetical protein [Pirellulaceae bacterium]